MKTPENNQINRIENSTQAIIGHVEGNVTQTVNLYLSTNETLKKLRQKIGAIDAKLQKKGIDKDFALYLEGERLELKKRYDEQRRAIEQAYYQVLKFNFTDEELKELQQLFLEGKHNLITQKVQPKVIAENIELRAKANYEDAIKLLILAKSTAIQFEDKDRFEKTIEHYELSLKADTNKNNLFGYAYFLQQHKQHNKATPLYEEVLKIYQKLAKDNPQTFLPDVGTTLNNLAVLQRDKNELEKAEKNFQEALTIRRKLAKDNPQAFLPDVGATLNNLANLQQVKNELGKAEKNFQQALTIRRKLAKDNPQTFLPDVAMTLNNLANLQHDKNELGKAEKNFQQALTIRRKLAKDNPQAFLPDVGATLNNLANLQHDKNELDKAEKNFQQALTIRRKLANDNPQTFLSDVAMTLNNLANLQRAKNELGKAEKNFQETLGIYQKLAKDNPQTFLPDVGTTLNNLAILQRDKNELEKAEKNFQEALSIRRKLAKENLQAFLPNVAISLISLGLFYQELEVNKELSIKLTDEAITHLWPFQKIPYIQNYLKTAFAILQDWDIDVAEYIERKAKEMENR